MISAKRLWVYFLLGYQPPDGDQIEKDSGSARFKEKQRI
jgi:hypothetical protein